MVRKQIHLLAVLVLEAAVGVLWEKNTAGWLVASADLVWEKNTADWLVADTDLMWEKNIADWLADKPVE